MSCWRDDERPYSHWANVNEGFGLRHDGSAKERTGNTVTVTVERDESNGRDDQHLRYRVIKDGVAVSEWIEWDEANEIARKLRSQP